MFIPGTDKKVIDIVIQMISSQCHSNGRRVTYSRIFSTLESALFRTTFRCQFGTERKKHIMAAWSKQNGYASMPYKLNEEFIGEFKEFIRCVANNYYTPGVGGTGEQERLIAFFIEGED